MKLNDVHQGALTNCPERNIPVRNNPEPILPPHLAWSLSPQIRLGEGEVLASYPDLT